MANVLEDLHVRPIVNGAGNLTILGGNTIDDRIWADMGRAKDVFLDMEELHRSAGRAIAGLVGAEDAEVSSGAFAGLVLSFAACITKGSRDLIESLPNTKGMKRKVIVQRPQRNPYEYCIEIAGGEIVPVGDETVSRGDLESAISEETAAVAYFAFDPQEGVLPLEEVLKIAHRRGVPVVVDAAAEVPPVENLKRFATLGVDLTVFSGGKDIGAPNDTGMVYGSRRWVEVVRNLSAHHYDWEKGSRTFRVFFGRGFKVSKEDVVGLVSALRLYVRTDQLARLIRFEERIDAMVAALSSVPRVGVRRIAAGHGHPRPVIVPRLEIDVSKLGVDANELSDRLLAGEPRIRLYVLDGFLYVSPICLKEEQDVTVVRRLKEVLVSAS